MAGGFTFILSQIFHIPFNLVFLNPFIKNVVYSTSGNLQSVVSGSLLLGLSAGIFEEAARYFIYIKWQRDARSWGKAIVFGAGHGGTEAILLGLLVIYTYVQMILLRNPELFSYVPENTLSLVQEQLETYWSIPWYLSMMGAIERALTIPFHISASVLVLQSVKQRKIMWLILAIIWHTFVNTFVVSSVQLWGIFVGESVLGLFAILALVIIFVFREPETKKESELPPHNGPLSIEKYSTIEITKDKLERSQYE